MNLIKPLLENSSLYINARSKYHQYKAFADWEKQGKPVPPPSVVKQWTIQKYARRYRINNFVETGTCFGDTLNAVKKTFKNLYSIELSIELYEDAKEKFSKFKHIHLLKGDSSEVLPRVIADINEPILFWLDAHYSCGVTARGSKDTPISSELECILNHPLSSQHIILIDDARDFNGEDDYPTILDLKKFILDTKTHKSFEVVDDIIRIHN